MANDGSTQAAAQWPLVKFSFQVKWDGTEMVFKEVTGLSSEPQVVEYRGGSSKVYSTVKMPGLQKFGNVTLKKGFFKGGSPLWDKYNAIKMNIIKRSTIVINLLDESDQVAMSWSLVNAFPTKMTATDVKANSDDGIIETLELAHEGLSIGQ